MQELKINICVTLCNDDNIIIGKENNNMNEVEKIKIFKSIQEINDKIKKYDRSSAIKIIKKVRSEHPGKEQIAYVVNNVPLEAGTDEMIVNTLKAEAFRLSLKLKE